MVARRAGETSRGGGSAPGTHDIQTEIITLTWRYSPARRGRSPTRTEQDAIDLLVNCAGGGLRAPDYGACSTNYEVELNCVSVLRLSHVAATAMTAVATAGHQRRIRTGLLPVPRGRTFCASKAFVLPDLQCSLTVRRRRPAAARVPPLLAARAQNVVGELALARSDEAWVHGH